MKHENIKVDPFFKNAKSWKAEMNELRSIVLESELVEELKWYQPCYTFDKKNIAIISAFKNYCVLSFFKGVLLNDPKGILNKPGANSQSTRIIKFTSVDEIQKLKLTIKTYIKEAIKNERLGLKVKFKSIIEHKIPAELQQKFTQDSAFRKAFKLLTPGRQRGYILYFSAPKQSETRHSRIEKCAQKIFDGKGLNDR